MTKNVQLRAVIFLPLTLSFLISAALAAKAESHSLAMQNNYDGKLTVVITDENSNDNMLSFVLDPKKSHVVNLEEIFSSSSVKEVSVVGKATIPTITTYNKCAKIPVDKNTKVVFKAGGTPIINTINCEAVECK